jgi:hypothetical protein
LFIYFEIEVDINLLIKIIYQNIKAKKNALAGNRTRAARVAGEHSTTEPPVLL